MPIQDWRTLGTNPRKIRFFRYKLIHFFARPLQITVAVFERTFGARGFEFGFTMRPYSHVFATCQVFKGRIFGPTLKQWKIAYNIATWRIQWDLLLCTSARIRTTVGKEFERGLAWLITFRSICPFVPCTIGELLFVLRNAKWYWKGWIGRRRGEKCPFFHAAKEKKKRTFLGATFFTSCHNRVKSDYLPRLFVCFLAINLFHKVLTWRSDYLWDLTVPKDKKIKTMLGIRLIIK